MGTMPRMVVRLVHQHRPEATLSAFQNGVSDRRSPLSEQIHVIHHDNAVVHDDSCENHHADQGEQAQRGIDGHIEDGDADEQQRYGEEDDEGIHQRLKLTGHNGEDEEHGDNRHRDESRNHGWPYSFCHRQNRR